MTEKRQKKQILKSIEQGYTEVLFHYRLKFYSVPCCKPQTPKAKAKAKMALASLVSSQKQKPKIAKNFMKSDAEKTVFGGGIIELS